MKMLEGGPTKSVDRLVKDRKKELVLLFLDLDIMLARPLLKLFVFLLMRAFEFVR